MAGCAARSSGGLRGLEQAGKDEGHAGTPETGEDKQQGVVVNGERAKMQQDRPECGGQQATQETRAECPDPAEGAKGGHIAAAPLGWSTVHQQVDQALIDAWPEHSRED